MKTMKKAMAMSLSVLLLGTLTCTAWADQTDEIT